MVNNLIAVDHINKKGISHKQMTVEVEAEKPCHLLSDSFFV